MKSCSVKVPNCALNISLAHSVNNIRLHESRCSAILFLPSGTVSQRFLICFHWCISVLWSLWFDQEMGSRASCEKCWQQWTSGECFINKDERMLLGSHPSSLTQSYICTCSHQSPSQMTISNFKSSLIISAQWLWAALIYTPPRKPFYSNYQIAFPISRIQGKAKTFK